MHFTGKTIILQEEMIEMNINFVWYKNCGRIIVMHVRLEKSKKIIILCGKHRPSDFFVT